MKGAKREEVLLSKAKKSKAAFIRRCIMKKSKKKWEPIEITKVQLNPEQAVLGCCNITIRTATGQNVGGTWYTCVSNQSGAFGGSIVHCYFPGGSCGGNSTYTS